VIAAYVPMDFEDLESKNLSFSSLIRSWISARTQQQQSKFCLSLFSHAFVLVRIRVLDSFPFCEILLEAPSGVRFRNVNAWSLISLHA
jgi:hypothetical protein